MTNQVFDTLPPKNLFAFEATSDTDENMSDSLDSSVETYVVSGVDDHSSSHNRPTNMMPRPAFCMLQSPPHARRKCETDVQDGAQKEVVTLPIWQATSRGVLNTSGDSTTLASPYSNHHDSSSPLPHKLPSTMKKSPKPNINPFVSKEKEVKTITHTIQSGLNDLPRSNSFDSMDSCQSHQSNISGTGFTIMMSHCTMEDKDDSISERPFGALHDEHWTPSDNISVFPSLNSEEFGREMVGSTEESIVDRITKRSFLTIATQEFSPIKEETREDINDAATPIKPQQRRISPTDVVCFPFNEPSRKPHLKFGSPLRTQDRVTGTPHKSKSVYAFSNSPVNNPSKTPIRAPPRTARKGSRVKAPSLQRTLDHPKPVVSRFDSDFEIVGEIGSGSFGMVYKVTSRVDGCLYAVKTAKYPAKGKAERDRMLKEVFALAALSDLSETGSFHIVRYHQAWIEDNRLYIQTELCNSTLHWEMKNLVDLKTEQRRYKVLREVLLALEVIHKNGMVHLDIKPENIFVKGDHYKLGDFGLVHKVARSSDGTVSLSQDNNSDDDDEIEEGDSRYMSKELLSGHQIDLTKCDIFSLGATMYEVCLDRPLEANGSGWHAIRAGQLVWPKNTTYGLRSIIQDMMHPDPDERPTAKELLQRRYLLSEEQRKLIIEQNKVAAATMQLKQEQKRLNLLSSQRPVRKLIRRATWDVDRMSNTLREAES